MFVERAVFGRVSMFFRGRASQHVLFIWSIFTAVAVFTEMSFTFVDLDVKN